MGDDLKPHSSKHRRSDEKNVDRKSKKRQKHGDYEGRSRMHKPKDRERDKLHITDDDPDDEDMWVEKNIDMDGERVSTLWSIFGIFILLHAHRLI